MKNTLVSLKIAKYFNRLEKVLPEGSNNSFYSEETGEIITEDSYGKDNYFYAPSQPELQKFLRENHNIDICINRSFSMENSYYYEIILSCDFDGIIKQESVPKRSYEESLEDAFNYIEDNNLIDIPESFILGYCTNYEQSKLIEGIGINSKTSDIDTSTYRAWSLGKILEILPKSIKGFSLILDLLRKEIYYYSGDKDETLYLWNYTDNIFCSLIKVLEDLKRDKHINNKYLENDKN